MIHRLLPIISSARIGASSTLFTPIRAQFPFYRTMTSTSTDSSPSAEFLDETWRHTDAGWVGDLELDTAQALHKTLDSPVKVLVLYGSQRATSYSRLMAFEASRILSRCGADVKVFQPGSLPLKNDKDEDSPAVKSIRELSLWSDAQLWVSPEQHGAITGIMKNQIDWIPLSTGSVRPTQGRTLAVVQVNGGSQSFNTVNTLRLLGRWMRMFTIPNQSSLPQAYTQFVEGRLKPSGNRERLVDVCEELIKTTVILRPHKALFDDRYSERTEKAKHGRLQTAEEKFALLGIKAEPGAKLGIAKE